MAGMEDSLVMRRPKRSTAGNRMEAALAEFKADEVGVDVDEDVDFVMDKDEEDAFGSDFESTDDEAVQDDMDGFAEKTARDDERRFRKIGGKTQLERITAAAHIRHQATFDPEMYEAEAQKKKVAATALKLKRRVSLGVVMDAETGEVMTMDTGEVAEGEAGEDASRRRSKRRFTVESRTAHIQRIRKEEEDKKSAIPKKVKSKAPPPTQDELIKRALEMEKGNVDEHKNYLATEEEKRKRARLIRTEVDGPLLRWFSKKEVVQIITEVPAPPPPVTVAPPAAPVQPAPSAGTVTYQYGYAYPNMPSATPSQQYPSHPSPYYQYALMHPPYNPSQSQQPSPSPTSAMSPSTSQSTFVYHTYPAPPSAQPPVPPPAPPPQQIVRTETVAKSYVVHELEQEDGADKPHWYETMGAMFGEHVNWEELRVFTGKNRPMSRPVQTCPITGQQARYLDPRTGVPFANVAAFKMLTEILGHDFIWDETLGCYTARADELLEASESPPAVPSPPPHAAPAVNTRKRGAKQVGAT